MYVIYKYKFTQTKQKFTKDQGNFKAKKEKTR